MLKKILATITIVLLGISTDILSNDYVFPCYAYDESGYIDNIDPKNCQTTVGLVNCDWAPGHTDPGHKYLYFNSQVQDASYQTPGYVGVSTQGLIDTGSQQIVIPNSSQDPQGSPNLYSFRFANIGLYPGSPHWKSSGDNEWIKLVPTSGSNPPSINENLYVSTKTVDSSGNIYVSTTGCPSSSQSGQSEAVASKMSSSAQRPAARAVTSKARAVKR